MSFRSCVYKGCQNYIFDRAQGATFSLFKFPKNPERRLKWMELGQAPNNLPESAYCYCSKHFDRKFLSINKCRTLLVGEAVPRPYKEEKPESIEEVELLSDDEHNTYIVVEEEAPASPNEQQDLHVESTTTAEVKENDEYVNNTLNESYDANDSHQSTEEPLQKYIKMDRSYSIMHPKSTKPLISAISSTQEGISLEKPNQDERNLFPIHQQQGAQNNSISKLDSLQILIDTKHVTTFSFRGEEFVQMSKEYYLNEKEEQCQKIIQLQNIIKAIKDQISNID